MSLRHLWLLRLLSLRTKTKQMLKLKKLARKRVLNQSFKRASTILNHESRTVFS